MATPVNTVLDFGAANRITNLAAAVAAGQPVTFEQLQSAIEGLAWKDSARALAATNVTLTAPGASIGGVSMTAGDRFVATSQTAGAENGIYVWNGAAVQATRSLDASTFDELEGAVVTIEEGTGQGTTWRQTAVNGTLGTTPIVWAPFGTSAPAASETVAGIAELATQAETDGGTDNARIVTPLKLKTSPFARKAYSTTVGDGSATSIPVVHNLGTDDVQVYVREVGGDKRMILCEIRHTSTTTVTLVFDTAPPASSLRVSVQA